MTENLTEGVRVTIETLDESKRSALESGTATPYVQDVALGIIDAHAAERETLVQRAERAEHKYQCEYEDAVRQYERAETAERALAKMTERAERAERSNETNTRNFMSAQTDLDAVERALAEARAECERLQKSEAEWKFWRGTAVKACDRAESRLADALVLLREGIALNTKAIKEWRGRVCDFFASPGK